MKKPCDPDISRKSKWNRYREDLCPTWTDPRGIFPRRETNNRVNATKFHASWFVISYAMKHSVSHTFSPLRAGPPAVAHEKCQLVDWITSWIFDNVGFLWFLREPNKKKLSDWTTMPQNHWIYIYIYTHTCIVLWQRHSSCKHIWSLFSGLLFYPVTSSDFLSSSLPFCRLISRETGKNLEHPARYRERRPWLLTATDQKLRGKPLLPRSRNGQFPLSSSSSVKP